jgi:hypothetical protein
MRSAVALRKEVFAAIRAALEPRGYTERLSGILTRELGSEDGIVGWLGLGDAPRPERGYLSLNPVVGVHDPETEKLVALFQGRRYRRFADGTIGKPLGYLQPGASFRTWRFGVCEHLDEEVGEVVAAIERYGEQYMRENAERRRLVEAVERDDFVDSRIPRKPVLLALLGERDDALAYAAEAGRRFRSDPGPAAPAYREFVARLEAFVG